MKDAFAYILEQPQWTGLGVITADSDGQHLAADIRRMDQEMEELHRKEERFLLLGCRNFHQDDVPFRSRFGNLLTCSLFRLLYGVSVTDTQTGLRGISWDLLSHMCQLSGERFEYEMNMLTDAALSKTPVHTLEISTVYLDNNSESHFNPLVDSIKIYRILFGTFLKYAVSSLFSSLVDLVCFTAAELLLPQARTGFWKPRSSRGLFPRWSIIPAIKSWFFPIRAAQAPRFRSITPSAWSLCSAQPVW